jgi:hypothetical protein
MTQRLLVTVGLVALVALAGCNGLLGGETATPTPEMNSTSQPTDPLSPTETDTTQLNYPDGYSPSGISDWKTAWEQHNRTVLTTSYTAEFQATFNASDFNVRTERQVQVDHPSEEMRLRIDTPSGTQLQYLTENEGYQQFRADDFRRNQTTEARYNQSNATLESVATPLLQGLTYSDPSSQMRNGESVIVYEVDGVEGTAIAESASGVSGARNATGQLTVGEEGVIRSVAVNITLTEENSNSTIDAQYQITYSDVGSTTVERPVWAGN